MATSIGRARNMQCKIACDAKIFPEEERCTQQPARRPRLPAKGGRYCRQNQHFALAITPLQVA